MGLIDCWLKLFILWHGMFFTPSCETLLNDSIRCLGSYEFPIHWNMMMFRFGFAVFVQNWEVITDASFKPIAVFSNTELFNSVQNIRMNFPPNHEQKNHSCSFTLFSAQLAHLYWLDTWIDPMMNTSPMHVTIVRSYSTYHYCSSTLELRPLSYASSPFLDDNSLSIGRFLQFVYRKGRIMTRLKMVSDLPVLIESSIHCYWDWNICI